MTNDKFSHWFKFLLGEMTFAETFYTAILYVLQTTFILA